jgi:DIS3-like exonuclease 1
MDELEVGIKSGRYFSGVLRCRSRDEAYVNQLGKDILIVGNDNRNRAGIPWNKPHNS